MNLSTLLPARRTRAHDEHDPDGEADASIDVNEQAPTEAGGADGIEESSPSIEPEGIDAAVPISGRRARVKSLLAFVALPLAAIAVAAACGWLKWQVQTNDDSSIARIESVQAAKASTIALLSYSPDTVDEQLGAARDLLTGTFKDSYTSLTHDVVIPAAKEKHISAVANVSAAASVSARRQEAVALVFVDQTTIIGSGAPTATSSVVRVTMEKVDGKWLISSFDPV